ncbi:hypothetical protein OS188_05625 [Xanthomarina sp. F1114]|uniref:hypothetical protein n=1 Tax=Xanthomarina sp. F1114 TaxID=2996019 RepID=UPI00225E298D|nr:hypothetical protein [Xanthomarina sp. F1114]MCX7547432.1 hypothetical protein [Xanthomarina sp. F1114]
MKTKILLLSFIITVLNSCDSSSDPITPVVVPNTFNHLYIETQNIGNFECNTWDFNEDFGTSPAGYKRTDVLLPATFGTSLKMTQSSAYSKVAIQGANRYVVSSGDRVLVYDVSSATTTAPLEFSIPHINAMRFIDDRFFMVVNYELKEYDVMTMTPITTFNPIQLLPTAGCSNMTSNGDFLYIIASHKFYKIDTSGSGSLVVNYPKQLSLTNLSGLEYVNNPNPASPCHDTFYLIREDATSKQLIKLDEDTGQETVVSDLTNTFVSNGSKISTVLDYTTEYYYIYSLNSHVLNTSTVTAIDLTPSSGVVTPVSVNTVPGYYFGVQLKD